MRQQIEYITIVYGVKTSVAHLSLFLYTLNTFRSSRKMCTKTQTIQLRLGTLICTTALKKWVCVYNRLNANNGTQKPNICVMLVIHNHHICAIQRAYGLCWFTWSGFSHQTDWQFQCCRLDELNWRSKEHSPHIHSRQARTEMIECHYGMPLLWLSAWNFPVEYAAP